MSSYPLGQSEADTITSRTGKKLSQITLDEVKKGNVTADDIKISAETLKKQGQVAKEADNPTMDANFQKYSAPHCAKLVLEAAEIYEKRGILR